MYNDEESLDLDSFKARELEILNLVAEGWTNRDIAEEFVISVNTVRWYMRNIYSKLGVHSRTLAIARARQLGLLESTSPASQYPDVARNGQKIEQQVRLTTSSDGCRVAYAVSGEGSPLVKAANWLSHLEFDWQSPVWCHWLTELSRQHTLIRYDERGCGLSDWDVDDFSLEVFVQDLEAIVDANGLERFPLLGISHGGPVCIEYAHRHPERVSHLILYGTYARGRLMRNQSQQKREETETLIQIMKVGWGNSNPAFRQVFTTLFIPEGSADQMHWFNELQRVSTSPGNAIGIHRAFHNIDVTNTASKIDIPTLILHAHDDALVPFEEARVLAAMIPGAQLVPLESKNHLLLEDEPAWPKFLNEIHRFLAD